MKFGLIGYPLGHSFSKAYFSGKFQKMGLNDFTYELYPLSQIDEVHKVLGSDVFGLNVTIPYKEAILCYLNDIDAVAWKIGAANTLVRTGPNSWKGFNTDASGFKASLLDWFGDRPLPKKALILGSGGSSKAVSFVLRNLDIIPTVVSRSDKGDLRYEDVTREVMEQNHLIINTTPLGMDPDLTTCPQIPFQALTSDHWLFDLVYNPANTVFLTRGQQSGSKTKNGMDMLYLQAEDAWSIWKSYGKF
jgi:shikimate dehydrogenase